MCLKSFLFRKFLFLADKVRVTVIVLLIRKIFQLFFLFRISLVSFEWQDIPLLGMIERINRYCHSDYYFFLIKHVPLLLKLHLHRLFFVWQKSLVSFKWYGVFLLNMHKRLFAFISHLAKNNRFPPLLDLLLFLMKV